MSICVLVYSSYKDTGQIVLGPTLMTLFYLSISLKTLTLNTLIFEILGLWTSTYEFGGYTFQPIQRLNVVGLRV